MAQWVNRLRNNIFVNPPPLPLLCEISGALHLAQPGLTAGRQAGSSLAWPDPIFSTGAYTASDNALYKKWRSGHARLGWQAG